MADIEFNLEDNSFKVLKALDDAVGKFLIEASSELVSQAARNSHVKTGQLKGSWAANIDEANREATIGSPLENAIWEELGTGEYAVEGNGRKGGWVYENEKGEKVFTRGKYPNHTLQRAYDSKKEVIKKRAEDVLKAEMGD